MSPETTLGLPRLLADTLRGRSGQQLSCAEGSDSHEVVVYAGGSLKTLRVSAGKATPQKTGRESREVPGTTEGLSGFLLSCRSRARKYRDPGHTEPWGREGGLVGGVPPHHLGGGVSQVASCVCMISISRSCETSYRLPGPLPVTL